eukprot:599063-Pelagomonas_calceolata.AAC.8
MRHACQVRSICESCPQQLQSTKLCRTQHACTRTCAHTLKSAAGIQEAQLTYAQQHEQRQEVHTHGRNTTQINHNHARNTTHLSSMESARKPSRCATWCGSRLSALIWVRGSCARTERAMEAASAPVPAWEEDESR